MLRVTFFFVTTWMWAPIEIYSQCGEKKQLETSYHPNLSCAILCSWSQLFHPLWCLLVCHDVRITTFQKYGGPTTYERLNLDFFLKKSQVYQTVDFMPKSRSAFQNKITVGPTLYCIIYGVCNCCDGHRRIS